MKDYTIIQILVVMRFRNRPAVLLFLVALALR
jgi:hypothetical protein